MSYARTAVTRMTLDMSRLDLQRSETVTLGDTNRRWEVTLINGGAPFRLPPDWTAALTGIKPDGNGLQNGCSVVDGKIIYDFAAGKEIATCVGSYPVHFDIWDEVGELVASPKIYVNVLADARPNAELESNGQYTQIGALIGRVNQTDAYVKHLAEAMQTQGDDITALKEKITTAGTVTIPVSQWEDVSPTIAEFTLDGFGAGMAAMLIPADGNTQTAAREARLSAYPIAFPNVDTQTVEIIRANADKAPDIPLRFAYLILKTEASVAPSVAIIGVDAYGENGGGVDETAVRAIITAMLGNVKNERQYSDANPPPYPVTSVNSKTGAVSLSAVDVGARPSSWTPTAAEVKADPSGTAASKIAEHNTSTVAHNDLRVWVQGLYDRVNALLNTDDTTMDETKEIVAYIKSNKSLIDAITASKVNKTDIINDLVTNVTDKPLSAAQGVALLALINALETVVNTKQTSEEVSAAITAALKDYLTTAKAAELYQPKGDYLTKEEADNKYVTPDMIQPGGESETPTILIPPSITVAAGVEHLIYKDCLVFTRGSLDNWDIRATISKPQTSDPALAIYNDEDHLSIKATSDNIGIDYTLTVQVLDHLEAKRAEVSVPITVVGGSVSGKTALIIGDSNTASRGGLYAAEIQHNLSGGGVTLIGTQSGASSSNGIGDVRHEGYNGAAAYNSGKGFTEPIVSGATSNPFYNPDADGFDFAYYMANQGYSGVSAVCINLGSNMIGADPITTSINPYNAMINSIRDYDPAIKIIIGLAIPVAGQEAYRDYNFTASMMHDRWHGMVKAVVAEFGGREDEGIYLAELCHCIDRAHDFPVVEVSPCDRGRMVHYKDGSKADETVTVTRQADKMHPHRVGLLKIADALWPSLLRGLKEHAGGGAVEYTVKNNLTKVINSNTATTVAHGASYSATLTAESGYSLGEVSVTMGGSAVSVAGGVINIASVTGNIVITATATPVSGGYTNLADPSKVAPSGATPSISDDYWWGGYYISNKAITSRADVVVANKIPVANKNLRISIKGFQTEGNASGATARSMFRVLYCDESGKALITEVQPATSNTTAGTGKLEEMDQNELERGVYSWIPAEGSSSAYLGSLAYIRVCGAPLDGDVSNIIITVDDPIQ